MIYFYLNIKITIHFIVEIASLQFLYKMYILSLYLTNQYNNFIKRVCLLLICLNKPVFIQNKTT